MTGAHRGGRVDTVAIGSPTATESTLPAPRGDNDYHAAYLAAGGAGDDPTYWFRGTDQRAELVRRYAWAVPDAAAIAALAARSPLVEIGAGTGYWARLLAAAGADIIAYDDYS